MAVVSALCDGYWPAKMRRGRRDGGRPIVLVDHLMEASLTATRAEDLGRNYFADPRDKNGIQVYASTHYGVDTDSTGCYVHEDECAYGSHGNDWAIHIEHPGFNAEGSAGLAQWDDLAMLDRSSRLAAEICRRNDLPPVWVDADALSDGWGAKAPLGVTDHRTMTEVIGKGVGHVDEWPLDVRIARMIRIGRYHDVPDARPVLVQGDKAGKRSLGASAGRPEVGDKPATGAVAELQALLVAAGYDLGSYGVRRDGVDGDLGRTGIAAVIAYRIDRGLSKNPLVDDAMWRLLDAAPQAATVPTPAPVPPPRPPVVAAPRDLSRLEAAERHLAAGLAYVREELSA